MPHHLLDIRQWQHHRQVHRKVDQPAHFARPTGATSKLKIRAHSYELLIILYYQEIIIIKYKCVAQTDIMLLRVKLSVIISHEHCLIIFLINKNLNIHVYNNYILYIYIYIYIYIHNYIYT